MKQKSFSSAKILDKFNLNRTLSLHLERSNSLINHLNSKKKLNLILKSDNSKKSIKKKNIPNKTLKLKQIFQKRKFTPFSSIFQKMKESKKEIVKNILIGKKLCFSPFKKNISNNLLISRNETKQNSKNLMTSSSTMLESPLYKNITDNTNNNITITNNNSNNNTNNNQLTSNRSSKNISDIKITFLTEQDNYNNLNIKKLNKSSSSLNTFSVKRGREKTFIVKYIPNWYIENNMFQMSLSKEIIRKTEFQKKIISDEITVLFEDINILKTKYLINRKLYEYFKNNSLNIQRKTNQKFEELIGLIIEISYIFLKDYSKNIEKFIINYEEKPTVFDNKIVENELIELQININKFNECLSFLKVCYDCYNILIQNEKNFLFDSNEFLQLLQFLKRARLNVSFLNYTSKNIFDVTEKDKKIINKFFKAIKSYEIRTSNKKETEKIIKFEGGINPYNYHRPKEKKVSDEVDKLRRLEKAFSKKEPNLHFNMNKFSLNSKLIDNLLKYSNEKYRNLILSERIIQNYREREKQEINENLDI